MVNDVSAAATQQMSLATKAELAGLHQLNSTLHTLSSAS